MEILKPRLKNIYQMYVNSTNVIEEQYKQFEDRKTYSTEMILNKKTEKNELINNEREKYKKYIDEALSVRLSQLEADPKVLNSVEYQTKLNNTISLINLSKGDVNPSSLDFIIEARDIDTLKAIRKGVSDEVKTYLDKNDLSKSINDLKSRCESLKEAMNPDNDTYWARLAIHETLN